MDGQAGQLKLQITYSFHPSRPFSGLCPIHFSSLSPSLWKAPLSLPPHTPREQVLFSTQGYLRRLGTCFARSEYNTGTQDFSTYCEYNLHTHVTLLLFFILVYFEHSVFALPTFTFQDPYESYLYFVALHLIVSSLYF